MKIYMRLVFLASFIFSSWIVSAQIINIGNRVENKVVNRVNNKIDNGIDKGLDAVEDDITGNNQKKNKSKSEKATAETNEQVNTDNATSDTEAASAAKSASPQDKPSMQTYSKYDFIPGEKVIFFDDFTETAVGDFPPDWNTNASGEVTTNNLFPGNWFKMLGYGCVLIDGGIKLPDNFTIEFDVIPHPSGADYDNFDFGFYLYGAENPKDFDEGGAIPGIGGIKMNFGPRASYSAYFDGAYTIDGMKDEAVMTADHKYRLSFWIQKTRLRVYMDQVKIFDLPKVFPLGFHFNQMRFELGAASNPMINNFRVAAGLPDMRSKLITEGKLVSYGIYFDVNKDVVKPESYGTLKGIADVLKENPTVRVKIVGHTDSDGADAANLDLSKRRGESVKAELVKNFGIDASRLESDGLGETKPVSPNDTPSNKAMNRRVEFIKL